jgi:hypothetical protein
MSTLCASDAGRFTVARRLTPPRSSPDPYLGFSIRRISQDWRSTRE